MSLQKKFEYKNMCVKLFFSFNLELYGQVEKKVLKMPQQKCFKMS